MVWPIWVVDQRCNCCPAGESEATAEISVTLVLLFDKSVNSVLPRPVCPRTGPTALPAGATHWRTTSWWLGASPHYPSIRSMREGRKAYVCVLVYLCLPAINEHCAPIRSEPNGKAKSIITSDDPCCCASPQSPFFEKYGLDTSKSLFWRTRTI